MRKEKRNVSDPFGNHTVAFGPGLNAADLTVGQHIDANGRWLDLAFAGGELVIDNDIIEHSRQLLAVREDRRWQNGEQVLRAANDSAWRRTA